MDLNHLNGQLSTNQQVTTLIENNKQSNQNQLIDLQEQNEVLKQQNNKLQNDLNQVNENLLANKSELQKIQELNQPHNFNNEYQNNIIEISNKLKTIIELSNKIIAFKQHDMQISEEINLLEKTNLRLKVELSQIMNNKNDPIGL